MTVSIYDDPSERQFLLEQGSLDASSGSSVPLYLATRDYVTKRTDSVPNRQYRGKLVRPLAFTRSLFSSPLQSDPQSLPLQLGGIIVPGQGSFDILNGGWMDGLTENIVEGQAFTVRMGLRDASFDAHVVLMQGFGAGRSYDHQKYTLLIQDALQRLNNPLQTTLYDGSGGLGGDANAKGLPKPIGLGIVRNAEPVLLDATTQIYQFNDGPSLSLDAARVQGGSGGAFGSDQANYAALAALSVASGHYYTSMAQSLIRFGSSVTGQVTLDFHGDSSGSGYVSSAAKSIERILTARGSYTSSDYDTAAIAALHALNGADCGFYSKDPSMTLLAAVTRLLNTVGGWGTTVRSLLLTFGRLDPPTIIGPTDPACAGVFSDADMDAGTFTGVPLGAPPWRVQATYRQNWTPQSSGLITTLTPDLVTQYGSANRTTSPFDNATVLSRFASASQPLVVDLLFDAEVDANAEIARLSALYAPSNRARRAYSFTLKKKAFAFNLGDQIWITHRRFLPNGMGIRVAGLDEEWVSGKATVTGLGS